MNRNDYTPETILRARATVLTVAQALGDDIRDTVVVGGLVPALRYAGDIDEILGAHVGTHDMDLGLDFAILDEERYAEVAERLREAGFAPDRKEDTGKLIRQRWCFMSSRATVEFIMPAGGSAKSGQMQSITKDLGAIQMIGIDLALSDREILRIDGVDLSGFRVVRDVPVCGDAPFVVLKALALGGRRKAKDAYDLYFTLRRSSIGLRGIATRLAAHGVHPAVTRALSILETDFASIDHRGPRLVCEFQGEPENVDMAADAFAYVTELLDAIRSTSSLSALCRGSGAVACAALSLRSDGCVRA